MIKIQYNSCEFQIDPENPMRRFKGKSVKAAPIPDPVPTPTEVDEQTKIKDIDKRRQRVAQAGRGGTILTSNQQPTGTATLLGRSTS